MRACDVFVFLDDVQMPRGRSYVSRCQVLGQSGPMWLSVPVHHGQNDLIRDVRFAETGWSRKHLMSLRSLYGRAPCYAEVLAFLEPIYLALGPASAEAGAAQEAGLLSPFNMRLIRAVVGYLGLPCGFVRSSELAVSSEAHGDDRLVEICRALSATTYVSGKGGQNYQDPEKFVRAGMALEVRVHKPIPYPQGPGDFLPGLSILDALFRLGRDTARLLTDA